MKKKYYTILVEIILILLSLLIPKDIKMASNTKIDVPDISGPVDSLPWSADANFLQAQEKSGAYVLMAGYCAVINNPSPGEEFNVHLAASSIAGIVVEPGEIFSQNKAIGPYVEEKGYKIGESYAGTQTIRTIGGGVCKIATTLYNVSVASNLEIIERHNHSMPVAYVPYGQDATVAYGIKDFKFKNNTPFPILIWAEGIGNRLYVSLYGYSKPPSVEWKHKYLNKEPAPKIYKKNSNLTKGEERILVEGMEGASVESWIVITYPNGEKKTKHMGISHYLPMAYIIETNN
ncbi:MAG TPA: VanW family protein [Eubacteriaceae bacterium]|jgi:vancomycin resistance protein VanW|nr:VanW family protein [Eubacteriaceae bacterium]